MTLPLSRTVSPALEWRESCLSTNSDLVARAELLPDLAVLATTDQTAGRGRLGRVWSAPAGSALAVSAFVRHGGAPDPRRLGGAPDPHRLGWLPLVAGVAMARAVRALLGGAVDADRDGADGVSVHGVGLKWPNDVLVDGLKLSGILTELTPHGVVVGAGLNLSMTRDELPVPTATSLTVLGVPTDAALADRALAAYLRELFALVAQWRAVGDPGELRAVVEPELQTLGRAVRVDRPGLPLLLGTAESLDDDGRLRVRPADPVGGLIAVAAGDVTHLRYE